MITPAKPANALPNGLVLEDLPFVPRMVMTERLRTVVNDVLHQWCHRDAFEGMAKYGIRPIDRLLFYGPPGNGKTMTCYWMARRLNVPLYRALCNQLVMSHLGETTGNVADVLDWLNRLTKPAICLFDEIESIFINRGASSGRGGDLEISRATTVLLQALDRWRAPVLLVMATNLERQLDQALLSRIDLTLEFPGPTAEQAGEMLAYWVELLDANGGQQWGPVLRENLAAEPPESFRELHQRVGRAARAWTAANCGA